ncbi:Uncharacterized protein Fot_55111 [Forsythia ovata]|uniref:Uncharacterized protein n=1 Tax=Forsythia ovata TaxID=205694 RepID=A0ABD1P5D3_9LAMI
MSIHVYYTQVYVERWKLARPQRANLKEPARYNGGDTLRQVRRRAAAIVDFHIHRKNTLLFLLLPQSLHVRFTIKHAQSLLCQWVVPSSRSPSPAKAAKLRAMDLENCRSGPCVS